MGAFAKLLGIRDYLLAHPRTRILLVFTLFVSVFLAIYLPSTALSSGDDHFFHFRFAQEMFSKGFLPSFSDFKAIYFSDMAKGEYFVYYNFLFYLVILPFATIAPLFLGIKLYAVAAAALVFAGLYAAATHFRVPYAFWWVVAVLSLASTSVLWRLFLSRPYVLAPMFLILLVVLLHKKKLVGIALTSMAYLFWHSASFFFPLVVTGVYVFFDRFYNEKWDLRPFAASAAGLGVGLAAAGIFAPGFFTFIYEVVFGVVSTLSHTKLPEGTELLRTDLIAYAHNNMLLMAGLVIGLSLECFAYFSVRDDNKGDREERATATVRATLIFTIFACLIAASLVTGRFGDYLFPLIGLYLMLIGSYALRHVTVTDRRVAKGLAVGLVCALSYLGVTAVSTLDSFLAANAAPVEVFRGVGGWLDTHTEPGTIVFNADWSWFPQLYYYAPHQYYTIGLEPRFMYAYNQRLFWLWYNISFYGGVCETDQCGELQVAARSALLHPETAGAWYRKSGDAIAEVLKNEFHSRYIVSSYAQRALNTVLDNNKHFEKVYGGDRAYYIYRVK